MARDKRWPSKWWFWAFPTLGALYIGVFVLLLPTLSGCSLRPPPRRFLVVYATPALTLFERVAEPAFAAIGIEDQSGALLLALALCEIVALLVGLAVYGAAALVSAVVPGENGGEGERTDGS